MDSNLNLRLAKEAGEVNHRNYQGHTWLEEYRYHLGMVNSPFPFERFRTKFHLLNSYLDRDPDGKASHLDAPINNLCLELGY